MTTECCGVTLAVDQRFCPKCGWEARASSTLHQQAEALANDRKTANMPRYTIEQQSGTIYFRLVEDPNGAWITFANHDALVTKLEARIAKAEAALQRVQAETREEEEPYGDFVAKVRDAAIESGWDGTTQLDEWVIAAIRARKDRP